MKPIKSIKHLLILILLFSSFFSSAKNYPVLTEIVTDNAQIFTTEELSSLRNKLSTFEKETTNQLVVLTIQSLKGESIESYALEVFNQNKLGQKEVDNGVLILFSKLDRKVRIEVGYGLEHVLTDVTSYRIIQEIMIPQFKQKEPFEGIDRATDKIISLISDPLLLEQFTQTTQSEKKYSTGAMIFTAIFGLVVTAFLSFFTYIGTRLFATNYLNLIEGYRGLLLGKIGLLYFPFLLFGLVFALVAGSMFIIMPLVFAYVFIFEIEIIEVPFLKFDLPDFNYDELQTILILIAASALFIIPLLIALFKVTLNKKPFKLSILKNDQKYITANFPTGSSSSSSSSSGGFSGGGGSSGGGGASGSW